MGLRLRGRNDVRSVEQPEFRKEITMKKTLKIEGMSCEHCVAAVKKALDAVDGVSAAEVDLDSGTAVIDIAGAVTDETLRAAIEDEGYSVAEIA